MSARRVLIGTLLTLGVLAILAVDAGLDTAVGSFALAFFCVSPALAEALVVLGKGGSTVYLRSGLAVGVAMILARGALDLLDVGEPGLARTGIVLGPVILVGIVLLLIDRRRFGPTLGAIFWVAGSMVFLLELRLLDRPVSHLSLGGDVTVPFGMGLMIAVVAAVKGGDTAAYIVGRTIGRTPMSPRISPRKTWEGAIGGFVVGTLLAALVGWALGFAPAFGCVKLLTLGAAANAAGQVGDLAESWAKRRADIKDSGGYLGELGGAFDILDALLLASPVAYFVARLLGSG